jgi:hypothetical protein
MPVEDQAMVFQTGSKWKLDRPGGNPNPTTIEITESSPTQHGERFTAKYVDPANNPSEFVGETWTRQVTLLSLKQDDPPPGHPPGHFYVAFQTATLVANSNPPNFVGSWSDVAGTNDAKFHMTRL